MADTDGDNRPEIFGTMSASGNYSRNVPYSDSSTWLMVFNDNLSFEFPPVSFPDLPMHFIHFLIKMTDSEVMFCLTWPTGLIHLCSNPE